MKITVEMENLNKIVEDCIKNNTNEVIQDYVAIKTKEILEEQYKDVIEDAVSKAIAKSIEDYIDNYEIKIGNPFDGQEEQVFTPKSYINNQIKKTFEDEMLITERVDSWSGRKETRKISFADFINNTFDIEGTIKKYMTDFSKKLRDEVTTHMQNSYNKATRDALSDVVMDTIMENEKFKNISNNIKRLGE